MNYSEAVEMANQLRALTGTPAQSSSIRIEHHGFFNRLTPAIENDGRWKVELWTRDSSTGNVTLTELRTPVTGAKELSALVRLHKGRVRKADQETLARIRAEQACV